MKVVLHAEAFRELREARDWYAKQGVGEYGRSLVELVDEKIAQIASAPESFPRDAQRSWARRARLVSWPYSLVFVVRDGTAIVLAVEHGRRRTGYWAKRRPANEP